MALTVSASLGVAGGATGGGGIALDVEIVGLAAAFTAEAAPGTAPELVDFLSAVVADAVLPGDAAVALAAVGVGLTVPDPNVPELMIYVTRRGQC